MNAILSGSICAENLYGKGAYLGNRVNAVDADGSIIGAIESIHDITSENRWRMR
jgi:hypothetical protein